MVLDHRVDVRPSVPVMHYIDYWGTEVSAFDVHEPHDRLIVASRSLVETVAAVPDVTDTDWEVLSDENVRDRFYEYLHSSPHVPIDESFREVAAEIADGPDTSRDGRRGQRRGSARASRTSPARPTSRRTRGPPSSWVAASARTSSMSRWRCCGPRVSRPATRPVTCIPTPTPRVDAAVTGQSHAWLEAWTGSWQRIDPTNGAPVGEEHVLVARGRDYGDVTPLKGVYNGPPSRSSDVRVTIRRVA